jgi:hypothetical protein
MGAGDEGGNETERFCFVADLPHEIAARERAKFIGSENYVGHVMAHGVESFGGMLERFDAADPDGGEHGAKRGKHRASVVDHRDNKQIEITAKRTMGQHGTRHPTRPETDNSPKKTISRRS